MKTDAFRRFLRKCLAHSDPLKRIELVLWSARGVGSTVESIEVKDPRDYGNDDSLEELVNSLAETAQRDANGLGTPTRYCLRARFEGGESAPRSTVVNVIPDDCDEADGYDAGEPANATGLVAQAHRHTEAFARQMVTLASTSTGHLTEALTRLTDTVARLERDKVASFEIFEELMSKKHEREIELVKEARKTEAMTRLINAVTPLAPIAAGKLLLGKKAPTEVKNAPEMVSLRELGKSLSPEELAELQKVLGPERVAAILEIFMSVSEEEEKPNGDKRDGDSANESGNGSNGAERKWH